MKNLISIFLLFCLIAPFTGTYIWLNYEKKSIKHKVKEQMITGMDKSNLFLLKFTKAEKETKLNWKDDKEFEYIGQMYDVVEAKTSGDTIVYRCWWDNDETKLNKKLTNLVSDILGNNQQNKENNKRLYQFFKTLYFTDAPNREAPTFVTVNNGFRTNSIVYISYSLAPPVPPPRFF